MIVRARVRSLTPEGAVVSFLGLLRGTVHVNHVACGPIEVMLAPCYIQCKRNI